MFGLGVFVGRGSGPVLFETRPFQERLGRMVWQYSAKVPEKKKVDLKFYDVLDDPAYHPVKGQTDDSGEITPGPEAEKSASIQPEPDNPSPENIPVKRSKKQVTWHQAGSDNGKDAESAPPAKIKSPVKAEKTKAEKKKSVVQLAPKPLKSKSQTIKKRDSVSENSKSVKKRDPAAEKPKSVKKKTPAATDGKYTIQVASYKKLKDALAQMVLLDKKGICSYKVSVKINGDTWYRVRTGSFSDYRAAGNRLTQLADSGVDGMVIKKE